MKRKKAAHIEMMILFQADHPQRMKKGVVEVKEENFDQKSAKNKHKFRQK